MHPLNTIKPSLKYRRIQRLGQGNFADVILVEDIQAKQLKALKRIMLNGSEDLNTILNEVRLLQNCSHPNIIKCFDYNKDFARLYIEMEYCEEGDLYKKILEAKNKKILFSEGQILNWVAQLTLALSYLHENRILHRDIKPQNIFLTKQGILKLGDFGIAKKLDIAIDYTRTTLGTPYYLSPEIVLGKSYSFPSDMWMMGIVVYELMTLEKPFEGDSLHNVMNKIIQQDPQSIPGEYSCFLKNLSCELLAKDPQKRLTIQNLLIKREIKEEINKLKEQYKIEEKPSKLSFQEYLKKLESDEPLIQSNKEYNVRDHLENDKILTKKTANKGPNIKQAIQNQENQQSTLFQKPPRQVCNAILNIVNSNNNTNDNMKENKRSHSLNNKEDSINNDGLKEININMETVIKNKELNIKRINNNKEETVSNFVSYIKRESKNINNQTQNLHKNEVIEKKHARRCSINTRYENPSQFFNKNFFNTLESQEHLRKISLEFLKKIFDVNAPFAAKRKILLKEFLNKKLGKKAFEDVEKVIEKYGESSRETLNGMILDVIGKENENYILIFNYLFNPECLYSIRRGKN